MLVDKWWALDGCYCYCVVLVVVYLLQNLYFFWELLSVLAGSNKCLVWYEASASAAVSRNNLFFKIFCFYYFLIFLLFRAVPTACEVPRLGDESELQLPDDTTATPDLSCVGDLHHSSWQCQILNPLIKARDWTHILMDTSLVPYYWATMGTARSNFFFFFFFFKATPAMEVPRLGVESQLQLLAYTTATAMQDPSCICDLHHCSQRCQILIPLSKAWDRTHNLMVPSWICFHCTMGEIARASPLKVPVRIQEWLEAGHIVSVPLLFALVPNMFHFQVHQGRFFTYCPSSVINWTCIQLCEFELKFARRITIFQ